MLRSLVVKSAIAVVIFSAIYSFAGNRSFTGILTDDMCASKHTMMPGTPDSDCVRACVKAGSKHALLVGAQVYKLDGKSAEVDKSAGQKVKIVGDLAGDSIRVVTIESAR
jgi:hypothetical protein